MQYSELKQSIQDYTQNSEATFVSNIDNFIKAAEDKVFLITQMPSSRKSSLFYTEAGKTSYELDPGIVDIRSVRMSQTADSSSNYTGFEFTSNADSWVGYGYGVNAPNGVITLGYDATDDAIILGDTDNAYSNPTINRTAHITGSSNISPTVDADTYKYVSVRMRQLVAPVGAVGIGWVGDFFWGKNDRNYIRSAASTTWPFYGRRHQSYQPEPDWQNDWQEVIWDLRGHPSWNGEINSARFDFYRYQNTYGGAIPSSDTKNAVWEISHIRFVKPIDHGPVSNLLRKDSDFLLEAYPGSSTAQSSGKPKYYSTTSAGESFVYNSGEIASKRGGNPNMTIDISPAPDGRYPFVVDYYGKSTADSITYQSAVGNEGIEDDEGDVIVYGNADGNESWLSVTAPYVLLYGALAEAYTFMKGDPELINEYRRKFEESLMEIKNLGESRQKRDLYRDGEKSSVSR